MNENKNHLRDVYSEMRNQLLGRNKLIDTIIPPLVFMLLNVFVNLQAALWASLAAAMGFTLVRLFKHQKLVFAVSGFFTVLMAVAFTWWSTRAESYFLPNIITNGMFVLAAFASLFLRRPLMAWGSYFSHKWPLAWYWHPRVNPAYMEVTFAWALFLTFRFWMQIFLYQNQLVNALGTFQILTGTPMTLLLMVLSYLYGVWRLQMLEGPSVVEFNQESLPPWRGQARGF